MKQTNIKSILVALVALGITGLAAPTTNAADKVKPSPEVEAKITETLKAAFPEVVINGMAQETEDGLTFFAVDLTSKGEKIDADVTAAGILVGTEQSMELKDMPKPAAKALKKATKGMKVVAYEIAKTYAEADKNDKTGAVAVKLPQPTVAYDADVENDGKTGEFEVSAEGKILESPSWVKSESKEEKD